MKNEFQEVAKGMGDIRSDLSDLRGSIGNVLKLVSDQAFFDSIETIDAYHEFYTDLETPTKTSKMWQQSFSFSFNKSFKVAKIFHYLKIKGKRDGNEACEKFYKISLVSYGKMMMA